MNSAAVPTAPHSNAAVREPDSHMPAKFTANTATAAAGRAAPGSASRGSRPVRRAPRRPVRIGVEHRPGRALPRRPELRAEQLETHRALNDGHDAGRRDPHPQAVQDSHRVSERADRRVAPSRTTGAEQLRQHDVQRPRCGIWRRHQCPGVDRARVEEAGEAEADFAGDEHRPCERQRKRPAADEHVHGKGSVQRDHGTRLTSAPPRPAIQTCRAPGPRDRPQTKKRRSERATSSQTWMRD